MSLFLFIPLFIVAIFLTFYIPGRVALGTQKKLSNTGIFAVSFILGIVLWAWQGYLFGFLHLRWLSYVYLLVFFGIFIKNKYYFFQTPEVKIRKWDWLTILIAAVGIAGQVIPRFVNGQMTSAGLIITGNNSADHVWHAALTQEFIRRFPPFEPGMYGVLLTNYHFWFNLVTADIIRVFNLPLFQTQFIGMYTLVPVLLAFAVYAFATAVYNSKLFLRLLMFFMYFSGDAALWYLAWTQHKFSFYLGWIFEDGTNFMDSPGRGVAVVMVLAGLYLLFKYREKISWRNVFIIGLLFGSLVEFKVYIGIPFLMGLFGLAAFNVLKKKFAYLWIFIAASIFTALQFLPFSSSGSGLFFLLFEIPRQFMAQPVLAHSYYDLRWIIYLEHHNYLRLIQHGIIMSFFFFIAQFGIKLFGFFPLKKTIKTLSSGLIIFLYFVLGASLVLGLFFYQKIGGANIWEFFLSTSVVLSIILSLNLALYLPKNKIIKSFLLLLIFVIVIPRWFHSMNEYLTVDYFSGFHGISNSELQTYEYLKNNTSRDSLILLVNQTKYEGYASMVNVLTERNLFLSGIGVGQVLTPEIKRRKQVAQIIKSSIDDKQVNAVLKNDNINYIYLYDKIDLPVATVSSTLREVFSNIAGKIFKVN